MREECQNGISVDLFLHCSLVPAVFIVFLLSVVQQRTKSLPFENRFPYLRGRFGIVVPLDFIGSLSNRWSYGFAFGAIAPSVIQLFSESYTPFNVPNWAKAIVYLVGALEVGVAYLPFFACLSTPHRVLGGALGVLYTLMWLLVRLYDTITCPSGMILGPYEKLIILWPFFLCLFFLLGRFVYIIVKAIRIHLKLQAEENEEDVYFHQFRYMTLADYRLSDYTFDELDALKDSLAEIASSCNETESVFKYLIPSMNEFSNVARKSWMATTIFSTITSVTYTFHVLKTFKEVMEGAEKFSSREVSQSKSCCQHGYLIVHFVQFLFALMFVYGIVLPIQKGHILSWLSNADNIHSDRFGSSPNYIGSSPKLSPEDKEKPLAINNRKAFHCFNYFFFFYNVIMGLSNCILRLLSSCIVGTWLVSRIDRTIMQRGYESMDPATPWCCLFAICFLARHWRKRSLQYHHMLPLAITQQSELDQTGLDTPMLPSNVNQMKVSRVTGCSVGGRARVRWLLLYTLLRNPSLILLRKRNKLTLVDNHDPLLLARALFSQTQQADSAEDKTDEKEPTQSDV
ncbi:hypothetical protein DNTS_031924 [Danionella cerebrum]|uniref:Uncharacterized protein n=1 Tax=Danionella cerebrum TaxID=2873325 RepID=A0A553Q737_9TELE|nr:hypothetical protein DNTS_031924 [Danionella translucida]